ncbi:MAG: apolipoprotein N-acyltransferase [Phycisphaerales bacterium]
MLSLIQLPYNLSFLAWIAYVPFVLAALSNSKAKSIIIFSYLVSIIYWMLNLYWLVPITFVGWFVLCLYLAVYWPVIAISLRFCNSKKIPFWFALPILIVGEETLRGFLFGWRFLAHSQFSNISLIQIADTFGTSGISFIIAMVNGLICDFILNRREIIKLPSVIASGLSVVALAKTEAKQSQSLKFITGLTITALALIGSLFYGHYRINQTPQFTIPGPNISIVQSNIPVIAGQDTEPFETMFLNQLALSRYAFVESQPALIIWPETMVETVLAKNYLRLIGDGYASKVINAALCRHANEGTNILVGAFYADTEIVANRIKFKTKYNTAFLYEPNEQYSTQHYNKIYLVPFGEYIPLKKTFPFLYKFLLSMTPYDFDYTLDPGTEYTNFKINIGQKQYTFAASICYEDSVPAICKNLVYDSGSKKADWLVNISNDGWFVKKIPAGCKVTSELKQHMAICVFRAIENRVPVVRCANTGISCMIDSLGNIKDNYLAGTLNQKAFERTAQSGWLTDSVKIDKRSAPFSKYPPFLALTCAICLILSALMSIYTFIRNKKMKVEDK